MTATASLSGTPAYMAPEALLQRPTDARADIFALGLVFYEMLGGRQPFRADTFAGTLDRILHEDPEPLSRVNPRVPESLSLIVAKTLAKDPAQRYATAYELAADLRAVQQGCRRFRFPRARFPCGAGSLTRRRWGRGWAQPSCWVYCCWSSLRSGSD